MMLGLHGRDGGVDAFLYSLGERLHKSVAELRGLPNQELIEWLAYFKAQAAIREVAK